MGFTTFSGPIRAGTVKGGAARNAGLVKLAQTATVGFASMTTSPSAVPLFTLPAGAKILNFTIEKTTAISGGSVSGVNLTVGSSGTANLYVTTLAIGLTAARTTQALIDAQISTAGCKNVGTTDAVIYGTFTAGTGNPTAGEVEITVEYVQRSPSGSQHPDTA